jgi:hypothetical protein
LYEIRRYKNVTSRPAIGGVGLQHTYEKYVHHITTIGFASLRLFAPAGVIIRSSD